MTQDLAPTLARLFGPLKRIETLYELLGALQNAEIIKTTRLLIPYAEAVGLPVQDGDIDYTSLPTFGGDDVDLPGVWSWDTKWMLIGSCSADMRIVERRFGVRVHVDDARPGRLRYTWGAVRPLAELGRRYGPDGYWEVVQVKGGYIIAEEDADVCPAQLQGLPFHPCGPCEAEIDAEY